MINRTILVEMLENGYDISFKRLSMSKLARFRRPYQVHCDDYRQQFSELYEDINDAVEKFVELKNKLYRKIEV